MEEVHLIFSKSLSHSFPPRTQKHRFQLIVEDYERRKAESKKLREEVNHMKYDVT
jgi:hypothetical protein